MTITMEKIKFYHPPSLPVRPTQKYPANRLSPYCNRPNQTSFPIPTPQHCPLPPQPPVTVPPSTTSQLGNASRPLSSPIYPNNFDRAIQDFPQESTGVFTQGKDRKDEKRERPLIPDGQGACEVNSDNLPCGTPSSGQDPSSPTASSTSPTINNTLAQSPNADLALPQNQDHEISETRTGNIKPMAPTHPITPSSSKELVSTSISTNLRPNNTCPQCPTPSSISTRKGKSERPKNHHTSVILDSQDLEYSMESVPHNRIAHQQSTYTVSEQDTTCQHNEPATAQGNEPASNSSFPSIAVVMPIPSHSPATSSKRILSSNQCGPGLEPFLFEDNNDSTTSDDENDADYIEEDEISEADQQPPASKRRKISPGACSSLISRERQSSKKHCRSKPMQQDLAPAVKHHQTSSAPSKDVYYFTGLLSYLSRIPIED